MATKRPTTFSMRMPEDLNEKINAYAAEHSCTKAEAMSHFARAGIEVEEMGGLANVGRVDAAGSTVNGVESSNASQGATESALQKIEERLAALQNLPTIEPEQSTAIIPTDILDKIQAYCEKHNCSEREAYAYYARLGVQLSGTTRVATDADIAEIRGRLDALAQDSAQKGEQLAAMTDSIRAIYEYTKPNELVLEGEVADDAEDVEEEVPSEEELQRQADERTRQIVSEVMEEYATRQREERMRELEREAMLDDRSRDTLNPWTPVLVAVILSLVIAVSVYLMR